MDTGLNLLELNYDKVDKNIGYLGAHGHSMAACRLILKLS